MAKKNVGRKSGAAGIAVVEGSDELDDAPEVAEATNHEAESAPSKSKRKTNIAPPSDGNIGIGEIRKAAAFANSIGGVDKAIALLQILKVAKEVQ